MRTDLSEITVSKKRSISALSTLLDKTENAFQVESK